MERTGELIWSYVGQENIMNNPNDMDMAIESAISQIEHKFGKGAILKLGSREIVRVPFISTGCLALESVLGIGGFPRGRVVEILGPESYGKTTVALHAVAEAQKRY